MKWWINFSEGGGGINSTRVYLVIADSPSPPPKIKTNKTLHHCLRKCYIRLHASKEVDENKCKAIPPPPPPDPPNEIPCLVYAPLRIHGLYVSARGY